MEFPNLSLLLPRPLQIIAKTFACSGTWHSSCFLCVSEPTTRSENLPFRQWKLIKIHVSNLMCLWFSSSRTRSDRFSAVERSVDKNSTLSAKAELQMICVWCWSSCRYLKMQNLLEEIERSGEICIKSAFVPLCDLQIEWNGLLVFDERLDREMKSF